MRVGTVVERKPTRTNEGRAQILCRKPENSIAFRSSEVRAHFTPVFKFRAKCYCMIDTITTN